MVFVVSDVGVTYAARSRGRGGSFEEVLNPGDRQSTLSIRGCRRNSEVEVSTLCTLCLRSLESSLGKGLATFDFEDLPLGLGQLIYEFVSSRGSRMAHMEMLKALAPVLRRHVYSLDFSKAKVNFFLSQGWYDRYPFVYRQTHREERRPRNTQRRLWAALT